jgi:hypothetical protein
MHIFYVIKCYGVMRCIYLIEVLWYMIYIYHISCNLLGNVHDIYIHRISNIGYRISDIGYGVWGISYAVWCLVVLITWYI